MFGLSLLQYDYDLHEGKEGGLIATILTSYFAMSSTGQTHLKNLAANAARFLKCI